MSDRTVHVPSLSAAKGYAEIFKLPSHGLITFCDGNPTGWIERIYVKPTAPQCVAICLQTGAEFVIGPTRKTPA